MAITSYSTLKTAIADWLDRDDLSAEIDTFIDFTEAVFARELRIKAMETALSATMSSGVVTVPSDYLELKFAYLNTSPTTWLQIADPGMVYAQYPTRSSSGKPRLIARDAGNFIFGPFPDSDYVLQGTYYAKLTALSSSNETNWFTDNAPDLLLYGALVAATPYIGDDERAVIWKAQYEEALREVARQDDKERWPQRMPLQQVVR